MASYDFGKAEIDNWIREHFPRGSTCLDVGACDGKWSDMLRDYLIMDACEVWEPNIIEHNLKDKYRKVFHCSIQRMTYEWYDLIIFGDVIEHMNIQIAQLTLQIAKRKCSDMIVAVPFLYPQGELYGNPYEKHIQDDLTDDVFRARYSGFEPILNLGQYCYYHLSHSPRAGEMAGGL